MKEAAKATFYGMAAMAPETDFYLPSRWSPAVMLALGVVEVVEHLGGAAGGTAPAHAGAAALAGLARHCRTGADLQPAKHRPREPA